MPLGAMGAPARFYWLEETTEGTAPGGNWQQFPAFSLSIGAPTGLQSDSLLSANARRNAADPYQSVARVEGSARVPLDTFHFARWLRLLMGSPTTSGSTNFTHVWKSGGNTLPSRAIEKAYPTISRFEVATGVRANTMEVEIGPDGAAVANIGLMCLAEALAGTTAAGTPVVTSFTRFHRTQGSISRAGSALAGITGGTIRYSNGMQAVPTIGSGLGIGGIDFGEVTGGGNITARFASHDLESAARALTAASITYTLTINANLSIEFHYPRCFLEPTSAAIEGPGGITRSYNFIAADDSSDASLLRVTLKNQTATHTA
jgi:hypothetical protein